MTDLLKRIDAAIESIGEAKVLLGEVAGVPIGIALVPLKISEDMHVAACKVLMRAHGLDGTPQRMLDAMLAAATKEQK